jgi:hypothetical protein
VINRFGVRAIASPSLREFLFHPPGLITSDLPVLGGADDGLPFGRELLRIAADPPMDDVETRPEITWKEPALRAKTGFDSASHEQDRNLTHVDSHSLLHEDVLRVTRPSIIERGHAEIAAAKPGETEMLPDWALPATAVTLQALDAFARMNHWIGLAASSVNGAGQLGEPRDQAGPATASGERN